MFKKIQKGHVIINHANLPLQIPDIIKKTIDEIWNKECEKVGHGYNGSVLSLTDIRKEGDNITLTAGFTDYKNIVASKKKIELGFDIIRIGVSGITLIEENNKKYILFATRTQTIEYPGFVELVPSGHIDQSALQTDGTIDYISKLKEEFVEETGLDAECIQEIKSSCLVFDEVNRIFDIGCLIKINTNRKTLEERFTNVIEYEKPEFIPIENLDEFVRKNRDSMVPTSITLSEFFQQTISSEIY